MAKQPLCPSIALLRSLVRSSSSQQCLHRISIRNQRTFRTARILADEEQPRKPFVGQLYESTAERVQRERAEQERFAKHRNESKRGRSAALTTGKYLLNQTLAEYQPISNSSKSFLQFPCVPIGRVLRSLVRYRPSPRSLWRMRMYHGTKPAMPICRQRGPILSTSLARKMSQPRKTICSTTPAQNGHPIRPRIRKSLFSSSSHHPQKKSARSPKYVMIVKSP